MEKVIISPQGSPELMQNNSLYPPIGILIILRKKNYRLFIYIYVPFVLHSEIFLFLILTMKTNKDFKSGTKLVQITSVMFMSSAGNSLWSD